MRNASSIAVVILTHNEIKHIRRAIESVSAFSSEIFVVDSGSSDGTCAIAKDYGAKVLFNKFENQAQQFQWAIDNLEITSDWVMRLDADEVVENLLASTLASTLAELPPTVVGVNLKRKHVFMGRWIRYGGRYPLVMLRVWRRGLARVEQRWMDEHIYVTEGKTVTLDHPFADVNLNDLTFFTEKHNKYATREALDAINQKRGLFAPGIELTSSQTSGKAALTRFIKKNIYNRIPFQISALGYFLYRYIFQFGFLDGREGAIYHVLQGFWYRYLVGAKIWELEKAIADLDNEAALVELSRLTGLRFSS